MLSFSSLVSVAVASLALFAPIGVSAQSPFCMHAPLQHAPDSQYTKAVNLIAAVQDKTLVSSAIASVNPNLYLQHNPDGVDGVDMMKQTLSITGANAKVVRAFTDQDYAILHVEWNVFGQQRTGFDIFRFQDGLVVEHWDNLQPVAPPNPSGHNATDGVTTAGMTDCDLIQTEMNKAKVMEYVENVYMRGQFDKIGNYVSPNLIQHNTGTADGISGMMALVSSLAANHLTLNYYKLHRVFGQGQFVLAVGEGTLGPTPGAHTAFYDLFRLDNGLIVEHWDVLSTIPAKENWKNENGKFAFPQQFNWLQTWGISAVGATPPRTPMFTPAPSSANQIISAGTPDVVIPSISIKQKNP